MPQAVGVFFAKVASAIVTGLTAVGFSTQAAVFILDVGIKLAALAGLNALYTKFFLPDIGTSAQSFTVTVRGTIEHQRIIYGETIASGVIWYMNTAGTHNQSLYYCIAVAGHEIEDMTDMWIDDYEIPEAAIDWAGNGSVDSGDFRGDTAEQEVLYFEKYKGLSNQTVASNLDTAFTEINSSHRGQGIPWFLSRLDYFKKQTQVWSSGAPNSIKALIKGKKVYDPRSDSTQSFGTGPHRVDSSGTWEFSRNPALCWADYMIDSDLGFGEDAARIDYGYVASAAEVCDGVVFTPVGTDNRFTCDGILSVGDTYETNIKRILTSMNGVASLLNGTWKVRAWNYETPTLSFNDDDLRDDLQIQLDPRENERYNTVRGTFIDKDRLWKSSEFPEFTSSEYVSRDNDKKLYRDISLHMTKDIYMAQRLAAGVLEQSDNEIAVVAPTNYHTLPAEIGGTIMLSNTKMGWTDKVFRVERYKFQDLAGIDLVLREDSSAAYTDVATDEYSVASQGSYVISNPGVPPPSSIWVEGRIDGNQIYVTPPAARLYESLRFYNSPTSDWGDAELLVEVKDDSWLHKLDSSKEQYYWASAVNYAGEESVTVPDSNYTDIVRQPDAYGTRYDATFDVSSDVNDFWYPVQSAFLGAFGEGSDRALRLYKVDSDGNFTVGAIAKAIFPVTAEGVTFFARTYVHSSYGDDSGASNPVLALGFRMLRFVTETGTKYITNPNTYTYLADARFVTNINSTPQGIGAWQTLIGSVDLTNVVSEYGATAVQPFVTCTASELLVGVDSYGFQVDISRFTFNWV